MRAYVITVAGMSSRFGASLGREALKCIYHEGSPDRTLLARLLSVVPAFDKTVIVGGYRFDELVEYVDDQLPPEIKSRLEIVKNDKFDSLASGWSLHVGLEALAGEKWDCILFAEGDLFLDSPTFSAIAEGDGDAISISPDPVRADRSVALYFNDQNRIRYEYSSSHGSLRIREPFLGIFSSGQVWRFADVEGLMRISGEFAANGGAGTNLDIIAPYFSEKDTGAVEIERFVEWINCNTVQDWRRAFAQG